MNFRPKDHEVHDAYFIQETSFSKICEKFGVILYRKMMDQTGHIFMNEDSFMKMMDQT